MAIHLYLKQLWTFFVITLKGTFRSFSAVFFGLLFPLVFISAFGFSGSGNSKLDIGLIDSNTPSYTFWKSTLTGVESINLRTGSSEELFAKFKDNSYDALIELQSDNPQAVNLYVSKKRASTSAIAEQVINTLVDKITLAKSQVTPLYTINRKDIDTNNPKYMDFVLPGLIGFSLLTGAIQGLANSFLTLKKTQALKRLFAAPASTSAFILGQSLARLAFSLIQVTLLLVFASLLFGYAPLGGATTVMQMYGVIILGVLVFQGLGFVIAGVSSTTEQAQAIAQLVTLPQFMLGGTFFPITTLPDWLQSIVKFLPLYSFNEAMRHLSLDGFNFLNEKVWSNLWPLGVWLLVVYVVASRVFRVK